MPFGNCKRDLLSLAQMSANHYKDSLSFDCNKLYAYVSESIRLSGLVNNLHFPTTEEASYFKILVLNEAIASETDSKYQTKASFLIFYHICTKKLLHNDK